MVLEVIRSLKVGKAIASFIEKKFPGTCPNLAHDLENAVRTADSNPGLMRLRMKELEEKWNSVKSQISDDDMVEVLDAQIPEYDSSNYDGLDAIDLDFEATFNSELEMLASNTSDLSNFDFDGYFNEIDTMLDSDNMFTSMPNDVLSAYYPNEPFFSETPLDDGGEVIMSHDDDSSVTIEDPPPIFEPPTVPPEEPGGLMEAVTEIITNLINN